METLKDKKIAKLRGLQDELFYWLDSECPAVAPPLEPYTRDDLSHDFAELLRIRLDEIYIVKSDLYALSEQIDTAPTVRDELIWHKLSDETPPDDVQVLVCLERKMLGGPYQVATFGKVPVIGSIFAWDAPKVIQWSYIPEYLSSTANHPKETVTDKQ